MARIKTLDDLDISGRRVLSRVDFNVPMQDGQVSAATRIERCLASIGALTARGAWVAILSHSYRPKGRRGTGMALKSIAAAGPSDWTWTWKDAAC